MIKSCVCSGVGTTGVASETPSSSSHCQEKPALSTLATLHGLFCVGAAYVPNNGDGHLDVPVVKLR